MALTTKYYIDSSVASNGGAGTIGSPWTRANQNPVQYALDNITRSATNGDHIVDSAGVSSGDNLLAGTPLSLATYGSPTPSVPLKFEGCGLNGGGSGAVFTSATIDGLTFEDCKLHSTGSARIIEIDNTCRFINCEFTNSTGGGFKGYGALFENCYFHSIAGVGILYDNQGVRVFNCRFANGANDFSKCIHIDISGSGIISGNTFLVDGSTDCIVYDSTQSYGVQICNNSIFATAGTGKGILATAVGAMLGGTSQISGNLVEGFSGTGGVGIDPGGSLYPYSLLRNAVYNCASDYGTKGDLINDLDNESLAASPFADGANEDFTPQDTGNVLTPGNVPAWNLSLRVKGAWPQAAGGGGGGSAAFAPVGSSFIHGLGKV